MKKLAHAICIIIMATGFAWAQAARVGWDGTWVGGWDRNAGVQLIFAGDKLIGFYWRGDYKDVLRVTDKPDGAKRLAWDKGEATLTRTPDGRAQLAVREGKNALSISLHRE